MAFDRSAQSRYHDLPELGDILTKRDVQGTGIGVDRQGFGFIPDIGEHKIGARTRKFDFKLSFSIGYNAPGGVLH